MKFEIAGNITEQLLCICQNVDRIYFSRTGCQDLNILPPSFPYPMNMGSHESPSVCGVSPKIPPRPTSLPFPATEENIPKSKEYLLNAFKDTAFNK